MTWLELLALVAPLLVGNTTPVDDLNNMVEAQTYIIEEQRLEEEKQKLLNETFTEWFITWLEEVWRIRYRLWRFSEEDNKFDCVWLFKAYAVKRGLLSEQEAGYINSTVMYLLSTPKKLWEAKRWDITYRSPLWDETLKHIAVVSRDYDSSEWGIRIIDNMPWNWGIIEERFLILRWDRYIGRRKIMVGSNPFVEIANQKWLEYEPLRSYEGMYNLSRYYSPVEWQDSYFNGSYESDYNMNCSWSCLSTANGTKLNNSLVEKVVACPQTYPMWTKLMIEDWMEVTCADRWGSIEGKRLDVRAGIGQEWLDNIKQNKVVTGKRNIYKQNLHSKPINETKVRLRINDSFGNYSYVNSTR